MLPDVVQCWVLPGFTGARRCKKGFPIIFYEEKNLSEQFVYEQGRVHDVGTRVGCNDVLWYSAVEKGS
jgi:hypothetical protein